MPRLPRAEYEPGAYHVFNRGNRKQRLYLDEADCRRYLALLARAVERTGWMCMSYCLMPNHLHLLIETRLPNLGSGMRSFHSAYAQYFNRRHDFVGHLFQDRFNAVPITSDAQMWMVAPYIARNPVAAGLSPTPTAWRWSSHADIIDRCAPSWLDADRLESYFGTAGGDGIKRYADLVELSTAALEPKGGLSPFRRPRLVAA